jgi:2-polyprenyl-3-methyl-5-hydroxy-6-metoxy-1,4-benzoquinol methylase
MNYVREAFWAGYYEQLMQYAEPWLDYSNERVQAQTFGVVLTALWPVVGRRCLDVGCGFGQLARALEAIGASQVTGLDVTAKFIERLRAQHPSIRWQVGTLDNSASYSSLGRFDRISLVEVLQYVPVETTLRRAWDLLAPAGRLVAVVPNRECPIVARAMQRFPGKYLPPTLSELAAVGEALCSGAAGNWGLRAMSFAEDQTLSPYAVSNWRRVPAFAPTPNRLVFAASRAPKLSPSEG